MREENKESPSLPRAHSLEGRPRHAVEVGEAGREVLWVTAGGIAGVITNALRKPGIFWLGLFLQPPANFEHLPCVE